MNLQNYKTKLEDEKKLIEDELADLGKVDKTGDWEATPLENLETEGVQDEGDRAERSEEYEERSIKLNNLEFRLSDIKNALGKINTENYGTCEICQKKIEEDRLEVNPAAPTCKNCMEKI